MDRTIKKASTQVHTNSFRCQFHLGANAPGQSEKSPNVLQENELMYTSGNPNLKNSRQTIFTLSYNWFPINQFSLSAFAQYFGEYHRYVRIYLPYEDAKSILSTYENSGDYHRTQLGASFNLKLLNNNLQIAASPSISLFRSTGYYDIKRSPFSFNASATYYLGQFYFRGAYELPFRTLWGSNGVY